MNQRLMTLTAIGAVAASLAMAGCSPRDREQAANSADKTMDRTEQKARDMGQDARQGMDRAKDEAKEAAQSAKSATADAGNKMGDKVADAVITTTVKAELAKDSTLSAIKINVDTDSGRVILRGTAPSAQAREHATALATGVKGVVSVDNQLTIEAGKS
jgi:hyperosmotically inducible periplasmic protein